MVGFLSLPTEILHRICCHSDSTSRKALCLTNRLLANIAQQWAFQATAASPLEASCDRLLNILQTPRLAGHVSKLYIITYDLDEDGDYMHDSDAEDEDYEPKEETNLPIRFWLLFDRLKDLPRLQSIALQMAFRSPVMQRAFAALAAQPQPLKEQAIAELHNLSETGPTAVSNIKKPAIILARGHNGQFAASDALLVSLLWVYPKIDFRALHFPRLKTLSLGNYAFIHDSQLTWILSHADTLVELYLDDCTILYEVSIKDVENTYLAPEQFAQRTGLGDALYACYPRRWADYFHALKDGLPHLQHFRESEIEIGLHEESYLVFCDGFRPSPYMRELIYRYPKEDGDGMDYVHAEPLRPSDEDRVALEEFCVKFRQSAPPSREE
ncbi:hypothetical protein BDV10DRAFT_199377 [Aspergillus recurvatus]